MFSPSPPLLQSLVRGPLLVGDLPEAPIFPHGELTIPDRPPPLNLQQKLGHLYEDALATLLEASSDYHLLDRNLQLQDEARTTIGELDFLIRDLRSGQLIHLELATKFYLAVASEEGFILPGPDARDNYFRKLQRLREHQLTLIQKHHNALPQEYRDEPIAIRQLIFGCLFDHIHATDLAAPEFINNHCRRGRWLTIDECADHFPPDTRFEIIPKSLWPVALNLIEEFPLERWTPQTKIDRCVMLRIDDEPQPYFVTPPGYPAS